LLLLFVVCCMLYVGVVVVVVVAVVVTVDFPTFSKPSFFLVDLQPTRQVKPSGLALLLKSSQFGRGS